MDKEYISQSDEELIRLLRQGKVDATDYLLDKYKNMVRIKARFLFMLGADNEDLIQEGMIGLYKAIRDYQEGNASFATFAEICVVRQMYTAIESYGRKKHAPLNSYISLYAGIDAESDELQLIHALVSERETDPEQQVIDSENYKEIVRIIEQNLSGYERKVLRMHLQGESYESIANKLEKEQKSVDNALQRIRSKIRKAIDKL